MKITHAIVLCSVIGLLTWIGVSEQRSATYQVRQYDTELKQFQTELKTYAELLRQGQTKLESLSSK